MQIEPYRTPMKGSPEQYRTFQVEAPKETHTRLATCEEVECQQYLRGWRMQIDLSTDLGQKQAHYIKNLAGRSYKKISAVNGLVELEFAANQPCFGEHRVPNGRPEIFRVKGGDHRGNPLRTPTRVHKKAEFWLEEFQTNQDRLKTAEERG